MDVLRFPLSSDQLELLLAFEQCRGLSELSARMGRDPSVVSRGLQRIADDFPVLEKIGRRWQLTSLGREANASTRKYLAELRGLVEKSNRSASEEEPCLSSRALLMVINAQKGLLSPRLGERNNTLAEENIARLMRRWRGRGQPVLHVKHVSDRSGSHFFRGSEGAEFLPELAPILGEQVIEKSKSGAFTGTPLDEVLQGAGVDTLVLAGFTANECVDATARQAHDLGYSVYVVGDATAMFDFSGLDGKLIPADRVHRLTLANLNAICARVVETRLFF